MIEAQINFIAGGEETKQTINLPPGNYQFICSLLGHFGARMKGTLKVGS